MEKTIIGLASDHAGYPLKEQVKEWLKDMGYEFVDFGTHSTESCNYPEFAHALADAIENGELTTGIAICGTGNGMAITLNHHPGIRAGLAWNTAIARMVKSHNDANILVLPARFVSYRMCQMMVREWMDTKFEGGRHERRIGKIDLK